MITIDIRDRDGKELNHKSIISTVYMHETISGYEVLINLKTRQYEISHTGGSSGGGEPTTESICIECMNDKLWHTIEWQVPKGMENGKCRFIDRDKSQVIVSYIDYKYLDETGLIAEYECPSHKLYNTFDKLTY